MMTSKIASSYMLSFFAMLKICYVHSSNSISSPLNFLKDLTGTRKGDHANGLIELKKYLEHLGYINYNNPSNSIHRNDDFFNDTLESAIKKYQNYYNLKITGFLDQEMVHLISKPRCGVPDHITSNSNMNRSLKHEKIHMSMSSRYEIVKAWPPGKRNLTFSYTSESDVEMAISTQIAIALGKWEAISMFRFRYSGFSDADIIIGFMRLQHGDQWPFDGPVGILAHTFYPTDGRVHFDADESWGTHDPRPGRLDVQSVALHELGHILGLGHSNDPTAVMYPKFDYGMAKRYLTEDGINAIRAMYPHN